VDRIVVSIVVIRVTKSAEGFVGVVLGVGELGVDEWLRVRRRNTQVAIVIPHKTARRIAAISIHHTVLKGSHQRL